VAAFLMPAFSPKEKFNHSKKFSALTRGVSWSNRHRQAGVISPLATLPGACSLVAARPLRDLPGLAPGIAYRRRPAAGSYFNAV
jgi:hypothetical protein